MDPTTSGPCARTSCRPSPRRSAPSWCEEVSRTGGHLGPNLGVVELTIALHRVFDSPRDTIVFDTGHQSYVHKLLTGRHDFSRLQEARAACPATRAGPSPSTTSSRTPTRRPRCPGPTASPRRTGCSGERDRHTVAVIGDGALTGGMAWEALNNIAAEPGPAAGHRRQRQRRSYAPTTRRPGRPPRDAAHHPRLRAVPRLGQVHPEAHAGRRRGDVRARCTGSRRASRTSSRRRGMFEDLGLKYLGPVDGHDEQAVESGAAPRAGLRRPGDRARAHPEGPRLRPRPSTTRPTSSTPSACSTPRPGCRSRPAAASGPTSSATSWCAIGERAPRRRRDHRRHADPRRARRLRDALPRPGLRRRHRRAARGDDGLRSGLRRAAPGRRGLRHLPQPGLRPAAHGLRHAPRRRDLRARPVGRHRQRRRVAQRHVGHDDRRDRARPAPRRPARRPPGARGPCARPSTSPTARPWCASPRARSPTPIRPCAPSGTVDVLAGPTTATSTCCSSASARWPPRRSPSPTSSRPRACAVRVVDPAGSCRSATTSSPWPVPPAGSRSSRTTSCAAASARR